jgi:TrmH family RNA methyltransferase
MLITSPANQHLRRARGVRDGREPDLIFVEGERLAEECVHSELPLVSCFYSPEPTPRAQKIVRQAEERECELFEVTAAALDAISGTVNSQGIIILASRPGHSLPTMLSQARQQANLIICLDAVQDPGNAGTMIRTAEAAGAAGLIALQGSVDLFAPKVLRSAMGSSFRLPIVTDVSPQDLITVSREAGIRVIATAGSASVTYDEFNWTEAGVVIFGNEANGISGELTDHCDASVSIPIRQSVNSLNVAASAAVILFEAERQRRHQTMR